MVLTFRDPNERHGCVKEKEKDREKRERERSGASWGGGGCSDHRLIMLLK